MTKEQYIGWRKADPNNRRARFLRGTRDPIILSAVHIGLEKDGHLEGVVIASESTIFPVGYASFAWLHKAFEFVEGDVTFTPRL